MANADVRIGVGFNIDKTGLNQIKSSLQEIKNLTAQDLMKIGGHTDIQKAEQELKSLKASISQIDGALDKAFNTDLGTLNVSKFNQALKGMNLNQVYKDFSAAGAAGQSAFRNVTSQILTTNMQLKQTHSFLNNMATTMANTVKWGVASSVMNGFTGSVQKAYGYVKSLDTSLNDIRIVTGKSADEMERFASKANNAAKELGKSTTDYTKASLIYYQQGLSDEDVAARAETTLKAANVTGQSGEAVSEQLTAVWNGYKVSAEEAELYIDKLAAVAATTAADLEELSTGMSKVASAADLMGVDIDQLNAQMATIVSVTRQAPESVGTALKTIYARMGDIEAGLDAETTLGNYTEEMKAMGVNVLDANGKLRDMGSVIEEIGGKWQSMSREQQIALSQTMAGTRQYNNLLSLFDNWDMYTKALETSANAAGTLQEQQDTYMESTQAHLNQLRAASEDLYDSMFNTKSFNSFLDVLTAGVNGMSNFVDAVGGGGNALLALGSIGTRVFSKQIAESIAITTKNMQAARDNAIQIKSALDLTRDLGQINSLDARTKELIAMKEKMISLSSSATQEEQELANALIKQTNELHNQLDSLNQRKASFSEIYERVTGISGQGPQGGIVKEDLQNHKNELKRIQEGLADIEKSTKLQREINTLKNREQAIETAISNENRKQTEEERLQLEKLRQKQAELAKEATKIADPKDQINRMRELSAQGFFKPEETAKLNAAMAQYEATMKNTALGTDKAKIAATELARVFRSVLGVAIDEVDAAIKEADTDFVKLEQDARNAIEKVKNNFNALAAQIDFKAMINGTVQFIGALGQISSSLISLSNLKNIISNDDLSAGEKTLQVIQSIGFALPMLITGLGTLKTSYSSIVGVVKTFAATQIQASVASGTLTAAAGAQKVANLTLAGSFKILGSAIWTALGPLAPFVAATAAVVGTIGAIVGAIDLISVSAKEAGEALDESLESYDEVTQELKSLETQLEDTKKRLKELQEQANKGELSLTDKEELARLEAENAELEANIELIKQKQAIKEREVAESASQALESGTFDNNFSNPLSQGSTWYGATLTRTGIDVSQFGVEIGQNISVMDQEAFDAWKAGMIEAQSEILKAAEESTKEKDKKYYQGVAEQIANDISEAEKEWEEGRNEALLKLGENYNEALRVLPALIAQNTNGKYDMDIAAYQAVVKEYYEMQGTLNQVVADTFDDIISSKEVFEELLRSGDAIDETNKTVNDQVLEDILGSEGFENLRIKSEALGLSMYDLVEQLQSGDISFKDLQESALDTSEAFQSVEESLKGATETKAELDSLFKDYEDGMWLDQDQVASILTDNPEYINYLTEVEGKYVLNERAMEEWTRATEEQNDAIDSLMGSYESMANYNDFLDGIKNDSSHGRDASGELFSGVGQQTSTTAEDLDLLIEKNQELNNSFSEGKLKASEYFESLAEAVSNSGLTDALEDLKGQFDETTDYIEEMTATVATELSDALVQTNRQFVKGEINVDDYVEALEHGAEAEQDFLSAIHNLEDLEKTEEGLIDTTQEMTEETREAAEAWNEMEEAQQGLEDVEGFVDVLTEHANFLDEYTDSAGNLLDTIMDDSRFTTYTESLSSQLVNFANTSIDNLNTTATALANAAGIGVQEATNALQSGNVAVQNVLGNSLNATQAMTNFAMGSVSTAITNTSSAIGRVLTALGSAISSFDYNIEGTPYIKGWFKLHKDADGIPNGLSLPTFGFDIVGKGSGGAADLGAALMDAGGYFSDQGAREAADSAMDIDSYKPSGTGSGSTSSGKRPSTGKGSGGGGGGKSKGSKPKEAETQDLMEKTVDRYRKVNNELKKLENQMNRLTKAQDHLFGKDLYDNLNKQLKLLDKQVAATERKLELARQERRELQKQLENYGFNIQNYEIQNYEQQLEKYRKDVNDLIKQYNKLSGDEQQGEKGKALQEKIDAAKEKYDKIEELIEEWTNLQFDLIPELKETILDLAYQKIEIQLEKFNISVDLNLDLRDAMADWYEFEKNIYGAADDLAESSQRSLDYINKIFDAGILEKQTEDLRAAREEWAKIRADENYISDIYTAKNADGTPMLDENGKPITDEKAAKEEVERLQSELMSTIESIYDETDQILDNYVQSVEDLAEAIDRYYDALEGVRDVIDHTMNMMKMIHGEDSSIMGQVYDQQLNSTKNLVQATKENSAKLKGLISEQQASLQDTNSKISNLQGQQSTQSSELEGMYKEDMTDEEKTAYENKKQELANTELQLANYERIKAAEEEALKTSEEAYQENLAMQRQYVEDYTQMLLEQYEYTINQASKKFTESLVGSMGMEGAQYEWDNLAREEDKYLDEINAAYELRKLERKINEDISGNDSIAAQQRLNKFKEEELKKLREKDKLTKYDVDRANQLYDIELKKIALLESQNNKSKMRLRRDASGNYSYQFVADEEDVAKKQQELDDATNELYNMDKDQYRKELQDLQALHKEYEDFRVWYSQQSAEFREANEAWYKQQCQMYEDQMVDSARLAEDAKMNTVESANMTIVNSSRDTMNEMTTMYNEAMLEEILPTWRSSIAEMCEFINTSESSFRANSEEAMNSVFEASDQLISKLQELSSVVGGDLTEVTSQYYTNAKAEAESYARQQQANIDKTWEQVQANKALVDSMEDVLNNQQLQDAVGEVGKAEDDIEGALKDERDETDSDEPAKQPEKPQKEPEKPAKKPAESEKKEGSLKVGEDITYKGSYYYDSYGTKPTGSKGAEVKNAVVIDKIVKNPKDGQKWSVHIKGNPKKDKYKGYTDLGWIKKNQITAYDTGGYTGAWNSKKGKMAMLHEKELVLNKEDTANILAVVKMVRDLVLMPHSNGSEEEYHIPLELQKVYDAILEKLDILTNNLISNEDLQSAIENGLIADSEEDLLNEQLTTEDVLSDVEELENLTSTVGTELEEATTLLDGVQESLTNQMDLQNMQNFNLEELGFKQMDLFGSLQNFMGTDFISQIAEYIEDFKSKMSIQSDKSMMMSNEQLQGIQKQLETLAAQFMQEVNINAEFPNVTDSSEIQFAFDNMENEASQYALNNSGSAFNWMGSR